MSRRAKSQKAVPMIQTGSVTLVAGTSTVNTIRFVRGSVIWARHSSVGGNMGPLAIVEASTVYGATSGAGTPAAGTFVITSSNNMDVQAARWFILAAWGVDAPVATSS